MVGLIHAESFAGGITTDTENAPFLDTQINASIDGGCKGCELNGADSFAGKIRQALATARFLHTTYIHEETQMPSIVRPVHALRVNKSVGTQAQSSFEGLKTTALGNANAPERVLVRVPPTCVEKIQSSAIREISHRNEHTVET